jgi:hypothetical protein
MTADEIKDLLADCAAAQLEHTRLWHQSVQDPLKTDVARDAGEFRQLALTQHLVNFELWHVEDEARRTDVDDSVIADCKRAKDRLNQRRNDLIERMDESLILMLGPVMPPEPRETYNTETMGSVLDRLSILALKVFHMQEQTRRPDVGPEHIHGCERKLDILETQRRDLLESLLFLVEEYARGEKQPRVYFQFKMYNDPALNPALYAPSGKGTTAGG